MDSLKPHKRPMSLAAPSIILDDAGNVNMVIGAAGGKYIATALSQVNNRIYFIDISLARNRALFVPSNFQVRILSY